MLTSRSNGGDVRDVRAVEQDPAGGRGLEPGDHPERRRLARPGRAEHREELAVADVEIDPVDRDDVAVALDDRLEADGSRRWSRPTRCRRCVVGIAKRDLEGGRDGRSCGDRWSGAPHCAAPSGACQGDAERRSVRRVIDFAPCSRPPLRHALAARGRGLFALVVVAACDAGPPSPTPADRAGRRPRRPREVNIITKDYAFLPDALDLVAGRDRPAPRHQRRPRGPRGGHRRRRGPGRLGGRGGGDRRPPARPDPGRHRAARRRRACASSSARAQRVDVVWTVPGRRRRPARPRGWSAATSPATGRAGCRSPSAGSSRRTAS